MEETIVRGALQGLIDDSKIVDKLCDGAFVVKVSVIEKFTVSLKASVLFNVNVGVNVAIILFFY